MARNDSKTAQPKKGKANAEAPADTDELEGLFHNAAAPAVTLHENRGRKRKALVWTFIIVGGFSILGNIANIADTEVEEDDTTRLSADANSSLGKALAHTRVAAWLSNYPSPLPGGYIVSWDGYELIPGTVEGDSEEDAADDAELHYFTLAVTEADRTSFYDVTLLVSVSDQIGATVAAQPSLMPRIPAIGQGWSAKVWPGYSSITPEAAVTTSVQQWAKALTESADAIRLYIGDEDPNRSYMPLLGASVKNAEVSAGGYIPDGTDAPPTTIIARVQLTLSWGETDPNRRADDPIISYDVLIEQAHTASPKIVAWGAPGTGPTLEKYGNAVEGLNLTDAQIAVPKETVTEEGGQ